VIRAAERTIEYFDDDHAPTAARAPGRFVAEGVKAIVIIVIAIRRCREHIEQVSTKRKLVGAMAVGKEAIVANAMESARQHVEQEAAHELADIEA
jgi:hypothetical protein